MKTKHQTTETPDSIVGIYGGEIKIAKGELDSDEVLVAGLGVIIDERSSDSKSQKTDTDGEFFTKDTYFGRHGGNGMDAKFHHGYPINLHMEKLGYHVPEKVVKMAEGLANHKFTNGVETAVDSETGNIMTSLVLDMRNQYEKYVAQWANKGALSWSSSSAGQHVRRNVKTGEIVEWPIIEFSLTPTPSEPRAVLSVQKSLHIGDFAKSFASVMGFTLEKSADVEPFALDLELYYLIGQYRAINKSLDRINNGF